ncbi:MAG: hypothetical protein NZZ60_03990 [Bacteroidia bacterium]|nr:hypothetical protein [Bacteroidia bacterium]MCX7652462.1 hypothetical protein [Bacteroidia bacterium]MDW8416864.1 hypothetical protein [Bacteroidia bacterium]
MSRCFHWYVLGFLLCAAACQREPKKSCTPPCQYNAPCVDGVCQCPLPFEGISCEIDSRDRFTGNWEGQRNCGGTRGGLRYMLWRDDSLLLYMFMAGSFFGSAYETLQARLIDPFKLYLPQQILRDTPVFISGYGEQRRDSLLLELYLQGSAQRIDTCSWKLKRR